MNWELGVDLSGKVCFQPTKFACKRKRLFSASNKSHSENLNSRQDWDLWEKGCWAMPYPHLLACFISFSASVIFSLIYSSFSCIELSGLQ